MELNKPKDTLGAGKTLQHSDAIVQSLIALRDELWRANNRSHDEVYFKINSCLYRKYPL